MALFTGTAGDDDFTGTFTFDSFDLTQGGADTAEGRSGSDNFLVAGTFGAGDRLDGGAGSDQLNLAGDYAAGLIVTGLMARRFEGINFGAGHDYDITLRDGVNAGGFPMSIYGGALGVADTLRFDGSEETASGFFISGGLGADTLIGGQANDSFFVFIPSEPDVLRGMGGNDFFSMTDRLAKEFKIDGGLGIDQVSLAGAYNLTLGPNTMKSVEQINLNPGFSYRLTLNDGNIATASYLTVTGFFLGPDDKLVLKGGAEADGSIIATGGQARDELIGGGGDDQLEGGAGADDLFGGAGDDFLRGGTGHDELTGGDGQDTFAFDDGDSPFGNPDLILDLALSDVINLSGIDANGATMADEAFTLIAGPFSGAAGELRLDYDGGLNRTFILMDTDGDAAADERIAAVGNRTAFTSFEL